jgi:hypothetical protein
VGRLPHVERLVVFGPFSDFISLENRMWYMGNLIKGYIILVTNKSLYEIHFSYLNVFTIFGPSNLSPLAYPELAPSTYL